jgi:hypothetical protein
MNSTFTDPRKVVVGVMLSNGSDHVVFSFPTGNPTYSTLQAILACMVDGYKLAKAETVSIHELQK